MKWLPGKPTKDGWYFAVVLWREKLITTIVRAYSSVPRGEGLRYLGQPAGEPGRDFPMHDLPPDRVYWEGDNFVLDNEMWKRFAGPIPLPEEP
jgi:hypothetical protein